MSTTTTLSIANVHVPALDIDAQAEQRHGHKVSGTGRQERRIVAALIAHLGAAGFRPVFVNDGEELTAVHDAKSAMELVFNLDQASLRFQRDLGPIHGLGAVHGVLLVLGNGVDIVSDWNYTRGDFDGFDAAMNAFDAERFA